MASTNPWLTSDERPVDPRVTVTPQPTSEFRAGASAPQGGVPVPEAAHRLPRRNVALSASVWWLGVHGGAGESTLAALAPTTRAADHAWPAPAASDTRHRVVLVARTNYAGLSAAQRAATDWASGGVGEGVQLAGLVLVADAPGRRPRSLREFEQVVVGGVPRAWVLPWVEAWRFGPPAVDERMPKEVRRLFADLSLTVPSSPASQSKGP